MRHVAAAGCLLVLLTGAPAFSQPMQPESALDQKLHDAWVNRAATRCRNAYETVRAQAVCMKRLRPQIDRRQCDVFRRRDALREARFGIPRGAAEETGECERSPRPRWGC